MRNIKKNDMIFPMPDWLKNLKDNPPEIVLVDLDRHPDYIWAEEQIRLMKRQDEKDPLVYSVKYPIEGHPGNLVGGELRLRRNSP